MPLTFLSWQRIIFGKLLAMRFVVPEVRSRLYSFVEIFSDSKLLLQIRVRNLSSELNTETRKIFLRIITLHRNNLQTATSKQNWKSFMNQTTQTIWVQRKLMATAIVVRNKNGEWSMATYGKRKISLLSNRQSPRSTSIPYLPSISPKPSDMDDSMDRGIEFPDTDAFAEN